MGAGLAVLAGLVLDPQGLPVPGVEVGLRCTGYQASARAGESGRFTFASCPTRGPCELVVRHPGFAPFRRPVTPDTQVLDIRLDLEPLHTSVEVAASPDRLTGPALGAVSLSDTQLWTISNSTADWIRYAKLLAGASSTPDAVYVNGMLSSTLPPAEMIARITVNADPFSAEYADGDFTHIDIATKSPDRRFRYGLGGAGLGVGGRDILAPGPGAVSRSGSGTLSGPLPRLPLTFFTRVGWAYTRTPQSVQAIPLGHSSVTSTSRSLSLASDLFYFRSDTLQAHLSYSGSRSSGSNLGVGGLSLPDAGFDSSSTASETRATVTKTWPRLTYRGGLVMTRSDSATRALSETAGISVLGHFVSGGPAILRGQSARAAWTCKSVFQPPTPSWTAGFTLSSAADSRHDVPNVAGVYTFESLEAYRSARGNWSVLRGNGDLRYSRRSAAPFFQKQLRLSERALVTAGLRADYQSRLRLLLSPRLSGAVEWRGLVWRLGGGLFAREIPNHVFVRVVQGDGRRLRQVLMQDVPLSGPLLPPDSPPVILSRLAPDLALPRQWMEKTSLERSFGKLTPGVEYTWTRERRLPGSRRLAEGAGWVDLLESNRSAERRRLHGRISFARGKQRFLAWYEWIHARDDHDGPFGFPAHQDNLRAEWARSAGVAPHNAALSGYFQLPAALSLTVTESWHGSAPFNITIAPDAARNGLYNDRGGRPRNSGNGPPYNALSLYASRRVPLRGRRSATVGVNADNLLGNRNYLSLGSVVGSATFGQPLAAMQGRSFRLWLHFH
jgi:hypothetical protein